MRVGELQMIRESEVNFIMHLTFLSDNAMEDDDIRVFPVFIEKYRFLI